MIITTKPKIGVMAIALDAYFPQFEGLKENLTAQHEKLLEVFPKDVELVSAGLVSTTDKSIEAGNLFRANDVDVLFVQTMTYSTSSNLLPAIRDLDVPIVLINAQKVKALDCETAGIADWLGDGFACGPVPEMVAVLQRFGKRYDVITGYLDNDEIIAKEVEKWCSAAAVRRRFKTTKVGQIGRAYPGMMDLYVDETNLLNRMGLFVQQFDWEKMWRIADGITDEQRIKETAQKIYDTFELEGNESVEDLYKLAAYVCGFEDLAKEYNLSMIASHYDGFAQGAAGELDGTLNPVYSMLIGEGVACAVEGDIKVAMAMSILKTISGTGTLGELYSLDFDNDIAILGHSGSGDAAISYKKPLMKIVKVFHGKTGGGFLTQFYPKLGDTTILAITQDGDGNFKMVAAEGVNEDGPVLHIGDTNQRTRFTCGMREFVNKWSYAGTTHHFAMASGRQIEKLKCVAKILNIPLEIITQ